MPTTGRARPRSPSPANQVENGDVDVALNVTPDLTAAMKGNKNVKILVGQWLDNMYMGVTADPALPAAEVRQALRHAVDRAGVERDLARRSIRIGVLGPPRPRRTPTS